MNSLSVFRLKHFIPIKAFRLFSTTCTPEFDVDYYCNSRNCAEIEENINIRKGVGNIRDVLSTYHEIQSSSPTGERLQSLLNILQKQLLQIPNKTHPDVKQYADEPKIISSINEKKVFVEKPLEFSEITKRLNLMRTDQLGHTCGHKSYYLMGQLAELEEALIKYTVMRLMEDNFQLVSVPDILPGNDLESCGMVVNSDRTQIYSLDPDLYGPDHYLSGTAEMALAGLLRNRTFRLDELPLKLAAVSRCYRAETSSVLEHRGVYRVHQFTKVEMFVVTSAEESDETLEYLRRTEEDLFTPLGFHMLVQDMPPKELGAPAYRKYDIEAWMPGRQSYGEISSCSNCTDYQSRRLGIKYTHNNGNPIFAHTLNGTACAIPRMLIAILETHQQANGKIEIPHILRPFMNGKEFISRNKDVPELKLLKVKNK